MLDARQSVVFSHYLMIPSQQLLGDEYYYIRFNNRKQTQNFLSYLSRCYIISKVKLSSTRFQSPCSFMVETNSWLFIKLQPCKHSERYRRKVGCDLCHGVICSGIEKQNYDATRKCLMFNHVLF